MLLELEGVARSRNRDARERVVLRGVSLKLDAGELVAVWGLRHSGRSTLLRVAAGGEGPDTGVVRFDGRDLARCNDALGAGMAYCRATFRPTDGQNMHEQVMTGLLARGAKLEDARVNALVALRRAGVEQCAEVRPNDLDGSEIMRVAIARALATAPRLLLIDEPTKGV